MRRVFLGCLLFFVCSVAFAGELVTETIASTAMGNDQTVNVYLPTGFDAEETQRYPVVYFLHGGNTARPAYFDLNDSLETLLDSGISPMILVYPNGGAISYFTDSEAMGNYETHLLEEVIPFIEANYPAIAQREGRALMGHSMGGTGAARIALTHPGMFTAFASIGGQMGLHKMVEIMAPNVASEATLRNDPEPDMGVWCAFLFDVSSLWSPNPSAEYGCDPVIGRAGAILEDVFERWKPHDPYSIVEQAGEAFGLGIYMDAGSIDIWKPASTVMHDLLNSLEIDHHYAVYTGDHNNLEIRYPIALNYLADRFRTALDRPDHSSSSLPNRPLLLSAFPNPFNSSTRITLDLEAQDWVDAVLYDLLGREVMVLLDGEWVAGHRTLTLRGNTLASGCYFLHAQTSRGVSVTKRLLLLR